MTTGIIFGAFDGLHDGHRAMLAEARKHADRLVVVLPSDSTILDLKGKKARQSWKERAKSLWQSELVDDVMRGDEILGTYNSIDLVRPDMIFLGYDQTELFSDLAAYLKSDGSNIPLITLSAYKPDRYKSSILNNV